MHPRLLKTFQAVARHRNITRASVELHLSQSAVSDQIQALEFELGSKLFIRSRGGLEVTHAGETFTAYAEEILSLSQEARSAVASIAASAEGALTIGALETIARSMMPGWLTSFRGKHPNMTVRLKVAASSGLIEQVKTGAIDIAFCFDRGSFDSRLATRVVFKEPMILIAGAANAYARHVPTFIELGAASFVTTEVGCVYRGLFDQAFHDAGITPPTPVVEAGSIEAIVKLVGSGAGIGLVPYLAAADALQRREINEIPWPGSAQSASLVMVWRRGRVQPPALKLILMAAVEEFCRG